MSTLRPRPNSCVPTPVRASSSALWAEWVAQRRASCLLFLQRPHLVLHPTRSLQVVWTTVRTQLAAEFVASGAIPRLVDLLSGGDDAAAEAASAALETLVR